MKKHFKISSALKNIIGKDLITDDFVAIFELVKNSFDANATKVDVVFNDVLTNEGSITIIDDGKGMDLEDIENKWLFVAYSAKKEGTEDYRDEIKSKRIHAGAKGIGRFSCDRLGERLTIYSRRDEKEPFSKLKVEWEKFEENIHVKFEKIPVSYELVDDCPYNIKTGTVLLIEKIRSSWGVDKIRTLRQSLEKLINPSQSNGSNKFSIYLNAPEFASFDKDAKKDGDEHLIINGKVQNFLFEKLDLKTTQILVEIDDAGQLISTELYDRGSFVYRMVEENPYRTQVWSLSSIKVHLFSLNQAAKAMFTRYMGIRPVQFGSVFVYKNGFRVLPIGEIGRGDVFGLDGRKQQGTSRFFGTRDLIGRIEINGDNEEFKEASSRDGGLVRNDAFDFLEDFFIENVLKRLERFAIGVVKFGNIDDFDLSDMHNAFPKDKALEFIEALTKSEGIHEIEFNPEIFDVVSNASEQSLNKLLSNLSRISGIEKNTELDKEIEKIQKRLNDFSKATKDAESEVRNEKKRRKEAEKKAREEAERAKKAEKEALKERVKTNEAVKETLFLRSIVSSDLDNVIALHHHIGIAAGTIENYVKSFSRKIRSGKPVTSESFLSVLDQISFMAKQISATTKFATKANFNLEAEVIEQDICEYMEEYVMNICAGMVKQNNDINSNVSFEWVSQLDKKFVVRYRPLELAMVIDGLINNSVKAGATKVMFALFKENDDLFMSVSDNGKGIKLSNKERIFEMGFTTTSGSGLGLHHAKAVLDGINAGIELVESQKMGATFLIKFKGRFE